MDNIHALVKEKGESFYSFGRFAVKWCLGLGTAIIALIMLFADGYQLPSLALKGYYPFVNFLMGLGYAGILVGGFGVWFYFFGLHYLAMGQLIENTKKEQ